MLYHWYELDYAADKPVRMTADAGQFVLNNPYNPIIQTRAAQKTDAVCEVFERTTRRGDKPSFGISTTTVDGIEKNVTERVFCELPFCRVLHFNRGLSSYRQRQDPRILLVAPMSGRYATLLRGAVEALLSNHEIYITDWQDPRDIANSEGNFDHDSYIDYLRSILTHFEGDVHVFAVCQPSVAVLTTIALMEEGGNPNVPHSIVLAGGPIDTRMNSSVFNYPLRGAMAHRGRHVNPSAIRRVALMTIEGEKNDITRASQCVAAHRLCDGIASVKKEHYGIFNGSRFSASIVPRIASFVRRNDPTHEEQPDLAIFNSDEAIARAKGNAASADEAAFTFAPANDTAADPMAQRLKQQGVGVTGSPEVSAALARPNALQASLRLWSLLFNWTLDGIFPSLTNTDTPRRTGSQM